MKAPNAIKKSEVMFNKLLDYIKEVYLVFYNALAKVPILSQGLAQLNKLFANKYYLYVVVGLSVLKILMYAYTARFGALGFFFLVGMFMTSFSKNMAVVLTMTLLFSSIFLMGSKVHEGMTSDGATGATGSVAGTTGITGTTGETGATGSTSGATGAAMVATTTPAENTAGATGAEGPEPNVDKTDRSTSLGSAPIDDVLNPNTIKNLTKETMDLMGEQKKLFASMNEMGPLLAQAQKMLDEIDPKVLEKMTQLGKPAHKEGLTKKSNQ